MTAYAVSRDTIRRALQELRNQGLVSSRQGQGSKVVSKGLAPALVERIQSVDELIKFGQGTRRKLLRVEAVEADQDLADAFETTLGRRLVKAHMLRMSAGNPSKPIAYLVLWMDALFEPIVKEFERQQLSVAELVERRFGVGVGAVRQKVSATNLDGTTAKLLQRTEGDAALVIDRRYYDRSGGDVHLRARSVCPADAIEVESFFQAAGN